MLGQYMNYSAGYWRTATTLNQAQWAKMELIGKKLMLEPGMKVLDIGCGYGVLAKYLAETYGVSVVGYTISEEQGTYARKLCRSLEHKVEIRVQDYRFLRKSEEVFDRAVSIEMIEHVGPRNYKDFFSLVTEALVENGLFLLQLSLMNHQRWPRYEPFIHKYIFPYACLPYYLEIMGATEGQLIIEDIHNMGIDMYKTIMAWKENFDQEWPGLQPRYGKEFYRFWNLYLLAFAAGSKSRVGQLWQIVYSKHGIEGGYPAIR
jgi:cyclopropane-fatty-acyl-phospholipid synthase